MVTMLAEARRSSSDMMLDVVSRRTNTITSDLKCIQLTEGFCDECIEEERGLQDTVPKRCASAECVDVGVKGVL